MTKLSTAALIGVLLQPIFSNSAFSAPSTCKRVFSRGFHLGIKSRNHLNRTRSDIHTFFSRNGVQLTSENYKEVSEFLNSERLKQIVGEILQNPTLLENISQRALPHPLGFTKIILMEDWAGLGWDLRLHIWQNDSRISTSTEPLHTHRWNFVSRILTGGHENHRYQGRRLTTSEKRVFRRALRKYEALDGTQAHDVRENLKELRRSIEQGQPNEAAIDRICNILRVRRKSAFFLSQVFSKYENWLDRKTKIETYQHTGEFFFEYIETTSHRRGDLYFHPVEHAHSLSVERNETTSTFVLVGPSIQEPGQLRFAVPERSTGSQNNLVHREFLTPRELKKALQEYLKELERAESKRSDRYEISPEVSSETLLRKALSVSGNKRLLQQGPSKSGFLDFFEVDVSQSKSIVLFSMHSHLGDEILFAHSLIPYLHKRYPQHEIRVISPASHVLRNNFSTWLKPYTVRALSKDRAHNERDQRYETHDVMAEMRHIFDRFIPRGSFVFWMGDAFDLMGLGLKRGKPLDKIAEELENSFFAELRRKECSGIGMTHRPDRDVTVVGGNISRFNFDSTPSEFILVDGQPVGARVNLGSRDFYSERDKNNYENSALAGRLLFGDEFFFALDPLLYVDPGSTRYRSILTRAFSNPNLPYGILNLESPTTGKYRFLTEGGLETDIVKEGLVTIQNHPDVNLFIAFPSDKSAGADRLLREFSGRVAVLPRDQLHLWRELVAHSEFVASWDTGLTHLANVFLPTQRVLTMSGSSKGHLKSGQAEYWRRTDQPFIDSWEMSGLNLEAKVRFRSWLEEHLITVGALRR